MKKRSAILAVGLSILGGVGATSCQGESSVSAPDTQKTLADADWYTQPITIDFRGQKLSYEMLCVPSAFAGKSPNVVETVGGPTTPSTVGLASFMSTVIIDVKGGHLVMRPVCYGKFDKETGQLNYPDPHKQARNTMMTFLDDLEAPSAAETVYSVVLSDEQRAKLSKLTKRSSGWFKAYNGFVAEAADPEFIVRYGDLDKVAKKDRDDALRKRNAEIMDLENVSWTRKFRRDESGKIEATDMKQHKVPNSSILRDAGFDKESILTPRALPIRERYYDIRHEIDQKKRAE